jgi:hypothetical protein
MPKSNEQLVREAEQIVENSWTLWGGRVFMIMIVIPLVLIKSCS